MNRWKRVTIAALAAAAATTGAGGAAAHADTPVDSDYVVSASDRDAGPHGSVIRSKTIDGEPGVSGADNHLVLYRSVDLKGRKVAVSGTVSVPKGTPPPGGWPLVSWGHGTTGVADKCAPSRDTGPEFPAHDYTSLVRADQARLIAAGYAVAQTDYQGLGTDGVHSYLIGDAAQRAVADIALAARKIDPKIGTKWAVVGHSQGGQAAIFAAAKSQSWAPQLQLVGAVAEAPASHQGAAARAGALAPSGSTAFLPLMIRGAQTSEPIDTKAFLTPRAEALLSDADTECIAYLRGDQSWGGLEPKDVYKPGGDTSAFARVLDRNDPSGLAFRTPVLVVQGTADEIVPAPATIAMVAQQKATGQPVEYRSYPGAGHREVLAASSDDVVAWLGKRFAA